MFPDLPANGLPFKYGSAITVVWVSRGLNENEIEADVKKGKPKAVIRASFCEDDVSDVNRNVFLRKSTCAV
jgi:hypothetical protein